jgi:hypothetical protein
MAEHTTAGKAFVARIVHQLVPTIEQDFWRDDPNKGDVIQHLCFFIAGTYTYCISRRNLCGGIHLRVR